MRLQSCFLIRFVVFVFILMISTSGFSEGKKEEIISFSGTIKNISKDLKSIIITNELNILIFPNTKITDEKGRILKTGDLKVGLYVVIEALQDTRGFIARKITIKPLRGT